MMAKKKKVSDAEAASASETSLVKEGSFQMLHHSDLYASLAAGVVWKLRDVMGSELLESEEKVELDFPVEFGVHLQLELSGLMKRHEDRWAYYTEPMRVYIKMSGSTPDVYPVLDFSLDAFTSELSQRGILLRSEADLLPFD